MLFHFDSTDSQEHESDSLSDIIQDTELENGILVESGENTVVTEDRVYRELIADNIETSGSDYWRMNKNVEQKSANLERIIQTFSSPITQNVCRIVLKEVNDFKNLLHDGLINYLQNLWLKKIPRVL